MSLSLACVVQAYPRLAGISFSYSQQGVAACGFLKLDQNGGKFVSMENPLGATEVASFLIETKVDIPCLVSVEAAAWPPPRCIEYRTTLLGEFFPFEAVGGRLPYSAPAAGAKPEIRQTITFDRKGRLSFTSPSSSFGYDLADYAVGWSMGVFVCVRYAGAGAVAVTNLVTGAKAEEL